jgi:hypothetical protein
VAFCCCRKKPSRAFLPLDRRAVKDPVKLSGSSESRKDAKKFISTTIKSHFVSLSRSCEILWNQIQFKFLNDFPSPRIQQRLQAVQFQAMLTFSSQQFRFSLESNRWKWSALIKAFISQEFNRWRNHNVNRPSSHEWPFLKWQQSWCWFKCNGRNCFALKRAVLAQGLNGWWNNNFNQDNSTEYTCAVQDNFGWY